MLRLIQIEHPQEGRRVAVVQGAALLLIEGFTAIYDLAGEAISSGRSLSELATENRSSDSLDYDSIYAGESSWSLLPAFDHPTEPSRCLVTGTGLTHKRSADYRQNMHEDEAKEAEITDSLWIYRWGVEGGHPGRGKIGAQPEWFYKGQGRILRAHGEELVVPPYSGDGGEEPEVAGLYIVDEVGCPWRVGLAPANEFSDHVMEKMNYLYLAPSKLRSCAIGPEVTVGADFSNLSGRVAIERGAQTIWSRPLSTGEDHMCHSLANLEHHHFKYEAHRHPGDIHIHFFGADAFSFGDGLRLVDGDVMEVAWNGLGRPLRNLLRVDRSQQSLVQVRVLS